MDGIKKYSRNLRPFPQCPVTVETGAANVFVCGITVNISLNLLKINKFQEKKQREKNSSKFFDFDIRHRSSSVCYWN